MNHKLILRNSEIIELRKKQTLQEIADKFNLTSERVRQILKQKNDFCIKHRIHYNHFCKACSKDYYQVLYENRTTEGLVKEGKKLIKKNRTDKIIIQKRILVKILRDREFWSYSRIGRLLKLNHSSIINLYNN